MSAYFLIVINLSQEQKEITERGEDWGFFRDWFIRKPVAFDHA